MLRCHHKRRCVPEFERDYSQFPANSSETPTYDIPHLDAIVASHGHKTRRLWRRKLVQAFHWCPLGDTGFRCAVFPCFPLTMDERARLRADFEQLQREYKNMEAMRKVRSRESRVKVKGGLGHSGFVQAYAEESLGIIRKQREMVEKLQQDNDVCGMLWLFGRGMVKAALFWCVPGCRR
jgi:hypothetical protein